MKSRTAWLLGSHLMAAALGALLAAAATRDETRDKQNANASANEAGESRPNHRNPTKNGENPIFLATGEDFRVAWEELLRNPTVDRMSFFIDWCEVDPEGAVLGFQDLYFPASAQSIFSQALLRHGAEMAEPLVEHWREFRFLDAEDVSSFLCRSLNALSKKDPEKAARLCAELPGSMRKRLYWTLFSGLSADRLEEFSRNMEERVLPLAGDDERKEFWKRLAGGVSAAEPSGGAAKWLGRASSREAVEAFAGAAMSEALHFERWPEFFRSLDELDGSRRQWAKQTVLHWAANYHATTDRLLPYLEACRKNGQWSLAETTYQTNLSADTRMITPPSVLLDWAAKLPENEEGPRSVGVGYALMSDPAKALDWAKNADPGPALDLVAAEALHRLADAPDPSGRRNEWLELVQDPALKQTLRKSIPADP